jgi:hypothetical protein
MPIVQQNSSITVLASDIAQGALEEIGALAGGETISPADVSVALPRLQRWIDQANARRELIFSISFLQFTLLANHGPHTIGPNGDFNMPLRPVRIMGANFILNAGSSNPVDSPVIRIMDEDWWQRNPVKSLQSSIVTHLYYDPATPLGNLNFWPVPNVANPVRLEVWNSIAQPISAQSQLMLAPGYWDAAVLSLAENVWAMFKGDDKPFPRNLEKRLNRAMRVIEANNDKPPRIDTDMGSPNNRKGGRPDFNFLTGLRE